MRTRFKLGSRGLLALSAAAVLASWPMADARATWVGPAGHSVSAIPDPEADAHVSFAVWADSSDFWSQFGVSAPTGADIDANYVYVYQVVNSNPVASSTEAPLIRFEVAAHQVTSAGFVSGWVFKDSDGAVTDVNPALGDDGTSTTDSTLGDDTPSHLLAGSPDVIENSNAVDPDTVATTGSGTVYWDILAQNAFSSLLWFTSDTKPGYVVGNVVGLDGNGDQYLAQGDIASAVPVPASLILVLSGLPMALGFGTVWRRRQQAPVTA